MSEHEKIDYVEYPSQNLLATKQFFVTVFGWQFEDFGDTYCAFSKQGIDGGFFRSEHASSTANGSALLVFYSKDLRGTHDKIVHAGGTVIKPIFAFPGGHRFHFTEPSNNEFAVWSDVYMATKH